MKSAKQFGYAGTKDKRAVTVQHVTLKFLYEDQLKRAICDRRWDEPLGPTPIPVP